MEPRAAVEAYDFILVKTECKGKFVKVNLEEILYIDGLKNYVSIYTKDGRIITLISIRELETRLSPNFIRVHKSYIISVKSLKQIDGNQVWLNDVKPPIPLGGTFRMSFFKAVHSKVIGGKS
jgi:DNA-binding LytR/AlgR family response regulator